MNYQHTTVKQQTNEQISNPNLTKTSKLLNSNRNPKSEPKIPISKLRFPIYRAELALPANIYSNAHGNINSKSNTQVVLSIFIISTHIFLHICHG